MDAVATGAVDAHASIEAIQEYAHHRLRRTGSPKVAAAEARDLRALVQELAFDSAVLDRALDLMAGSAVRGRNAVHAATASVHGIDHIISPDAAFDALAWLTRLDPLTFAPVRAS
jgi:predicted nucleic acid-binding protein